MEQIVVGMDGSSGAADALRWAVDEGRLCDRPVTAILAWDDSLPHVGFSEDVVVSVNAAEAAVELDGYVRAALGPTTDHEIEQRVVRGDPVDVLLETARPGDLLVVGARGLGTMRGLLLGSVSQRCLHESTSPVVVVRAVASPHSGVQHIVVGVDGSETSIRALAWSLDEARRRHAEVEVVHTWHLPYLGGYPYAVPIDTAIFQDEAVALVERLIADADTSGLPGPIVRTIGADGAVQAVLDAAKDADLVVIGSRGLGGFRGMALGSVSHAVTHHAPCPVVVMPHDQS